MIKKYTKLISGIVIIIGLFAIFNVAHAGIVPNCNTGEVVGTSFSNPCDFRNLMILINNFINFLFVYLATPLAAIIICYVGFLLLTSGGSSEKVSTAKKIIKNLIFGYVIALAAWIIVNTIFNVLGAKDCLNWLGKEIKNCEVTKTSETI
jgi:hypothetical protein